ncbi:MAG: bifunctional 4-hydroxy-2-oxoglutarate aldolase/2-dehydro-3-deoxy-phosphogluconate aldolase [Ruthenibacterium sp.]
MHEVLRTLSEIGIVPVVALKDAADAVPLARALCAGGIPTAEVTFRTDAAAASIAAMRQEVPEMLVGAGTVLTVENAEAAVAAGAAYIVTPGISEPWCAGASKHGVPVLPGVSTASEVRKCEYGIEIMKFFPAAASGGIAMLKGLYGPFQKVCFVPTGGVNASNLNDFLRLPNVIACGGTWMLPADAIREKNFAAVTALCAEAVRVMHGFTLLHVGMNTSGPQEARQTAGAFAALFGLPVIDLPAAVFAGTMLEVVKKPFLGTHGHIAVAVNDIDRAVAYFKRRGYAFREEGVARDDKGLIAIYFEQEFGGFALHLRRKD